MIRRILTAIVLPIAFGYLFGGFVTACGAGLSDFDDLNSPADDKALTDCRREMRKARDAGEADAKALYSVYFLCTQDAGLR